MTSLMCRRFLGQVGRSTARTGFFFAPKWRFKNGLAPKTFVGFERNLCGCRTLDRYTVLRHFSANKSSPDEAEVKPEKLSIFQRFKKMYRDYWYVLVPVHIATSAVWIGSFYYIAKSGIDVVALLESWNVSDVIVNPLKDSSVGYFAITYALYKIATPFRYTITLGGTTLSINYLKKWGYIKPVPSSQQLRELYEEKKENILVTMKDKTDELKLKTDQFKDKRDNIIENVEKKIIVKKKVLEDIGKSFKKVKKEH